MALFDWLKGKQETTTPTKKQPARPTPQDYTENMICNAPLTKGLYHNTYPGLKLAGAMAFPVIAIPVNFMGLPVPTAKNEEDQEIMNSLLEMFSGRMRKINVQSHREGTVWPWPWYDANQQRVRWMLIEDETVSDVLVDIDSRDIIELITDEEINIKVAEDDIKTIRRRRSFTSDRITTRWQGQISNQQDTRSRNPVSIIPIPFANNSDGDEHRGHSDFERVVTDLKDYHDIDLAQSTMLAKFRVKMIQTFSSSVDEWLDNNGFDSLADVDIAATDLIMNLNEKETTEYLYPQRAHDAWEDGLKRKYRKIVEGSSIPELLWGISIAGNYASSEQAMDTFVAYVKEKQNQKTDPYYKLFDGTLRLMMAAGQISRVPEFEIKWNNLSAISEKVKSEIFAGFASGVGKLIDAAGITKEQAHKIWLEMYPGATTEDYESFRSGLSEMAKHKQYKDESYVTAYGMENDEDFSE